MFRDVRVEGVAIEADRPIATRLLGNVERVVRRANQLVAIRDAWVGPAGDTEAHRALDRAAVEGECTRLYFFPHPLGKGHRGVEDGAGEEQHELLPAVAPDAIDLLARLVLQDPRKLFEYGIPRLMAVGVVNGLEAIQIAHHAGQRLVQSPR